MKTTDNLEQLLPFATLINTLDTFFTKEVNCPIRHHHHIDVEGKKDATLLLMPAWVKGQYLGVKQVSVFPSNAELGIPALSSFYLLSSATTGEALAQFDGNIITARRTAAAAALAARYLSRKNAKKLLMVGAGKVAQQLIPAMCEVRDIEEVKIYNISPARAQSLAAKVAHEGLKVSVVNKDELPSAVAWADIVSCATLSEKPMILGDWVSPGTHVDLIGSFTPTMREADNQLMAKANVFVDFKEAALVETGDILTPIAEGAITERDILGDFFDLSRGRHKGRSSFANPEKDISVFKAVGSSIEDLATATLAYESL